MSVIPASQLTGDIVQLARTNSMHYTASGRIGSNESAGLIGNAGKSGMEKAQGGDFESAMLKALDGVNADQARSNSLIEQAIVDPDSVDAHTLTTSMAEASLSLNLAKTLLSRVVTAWKDVINTR